MEQNHTKTEKLEKLHDLFTTALSFGQDQEIPISIILQMASYTLAEFGLWKSHDDLTSVAGLFLHSLEVSAMKRITSEQLEEIKKYVKIDVDVDEAAIGLENAATALIILSSFRSIENMLETHDRLSQRLH